MSRKRIIAALLIVGSQLLIGPVIASDPPPVMTEAFIKAHSAEIRSVLKKGEEAWATKDKVKIAAFVSEYYFFDTFDAEEIKKGQLSIRAEIAKQSDKSIEGKAKHMVKVLSMAKALTPKFSSSNKGTVAMFSSPDGLRFMAVLVDGKWRLSL